MASTRSAGYLCWPFIDFPSELFPFRTVQASRQGRCRHVHPDLRRLPQSLLTFYPSRSTREGHSVDTGRFSAPGRISSAPFVQGGRPPKPARPSGSRGAFSTHRDQTPRNSGSQLKSGVPVERYSPGEPVLTSPIPPRPSPHGWVLAVDLAVRSRRCRAQSRVHGGGWMIPHRVGFTIVSLSPEIRPLRMNEPAGCPQRSWTRTKPSTEAIFSHTLGAYQGNRPPAISRRTFVLHRFLR